MEGKFWMCYVEGSAGCRMTHPCEGDAMEEAQRLAKLPGNETKRVYVLQSIRYCQTEYPPVVWHEM
jgi:hypothetical protein